MSGKKSGWAPKLPSGNSKSQPNNSQNRISRKTLLVERKTFEGRKSGFKKYINESGIMETLTKIMLGLYDEPEKPLDGAEYMHDKLDPGNPIRLRLEELLIEEESLEEQVAELEKVNEILMEQLAVYEGQKYEAAGELEGDELETDAEFSDPDQL